MLIIGVGISLWRPEWRKAAQRAATPVIRRGASRLLERVGIYHSEARTAERPAPAPARRGRRDAPGAGSPEGAAAAYRREAQIYRRLGDPNAAAVEELKAGRYHSEGRLYLHSEEPPPPPRHRERLEPVYGALLGA